MKAVQINQYGGIDVLRINEDASKPTVSKGEAFRHLEKGHLRGKVILKIK